MIAEIIILNASFGEKCVKITQQRHHQTNFLKCMKRIASDTKMFGATFQNKISIFAKTKKK